MRKKVQGIGAGLALLAAGSGAGHASLGTAVAGHGALPLAPGRTPSLPLRGLTLDSVDNLPAIVAAVAAHHRAPTVRIVFDPDLTPNAYAPAVHALRPSAWIMGELGDSAAMQGQSVAAVRLRALRYTAALGHDVDIWEIGNEVNGSWVGRDPAEINAKVAAAFDVVSRIRQSRTALTLNYWSGPACYQKPWEETLGFARGMPAEVRKGVTFVFLSVYETACDPAQHPDAAQLGATLVALGRIFPHARLGIGEVGAQGRADGLAADPKLAEKQRVARRYYGMHAALARQVGPRFVGGWFWWYYREDAVPRDAAGSLWPLLDGLFSTLGEQ